jgi:hypothetical protein
MGLRSGVGIWDPDKTYSGSRVKKPRISDPDPQHWKNLRSMMEIRGARAQTKQKINHKNNNST